MMTAPELEREALQAITLIKTFSLELEHYSPESQVITWVHQYRAAWIRDAIIEAVYQGRYKIISVQHILDLWQRRGQPVCHFTSGFEKVIATQLGTPIHLSPSMLTHPPQPVDKFVHHYVRDEPQLPMPSADRPTVQNTAKSTAQEVLVDSSVISASRYSRLSIEAFQVEAENTLVELYQASVPDQAHVSAARDLVTELNTSIASPGDEKSIYRSRYTPPGESAPIQPFRPTPRRQQLSKR